MLLVTWGAGHTGRTTSQVLTDRLHNGESVVCDYVSWESAGAVLAKASRCPLVNGYMCGALGLSRRPDGDLVEKLVLSLAAADQRQVRQN